MAQKKLKPKVNLPKNVQNKKGTKKGSAVTKRASKYCGFYVNYRTYNIMFRSTNTVKKEGYYRNTKIETGDT